MRKELVYQKIIFLLLIFLRVLVNALSQSEEKYNSKFGLGMANFTTSEGGWYFAIRQQKLKYVIGM